MKLGGRLQRREGNGCSYEIVDAGARTCRDMSSLFNVTGSLVKS